MIHLPNLSHKLSLPAITRVAHLNDALTLIYTMRCSSRIIANCNKSARPEKEEELREKSFPDTAFTENYGIGY